MANNTARLGDLATYVNGYAFKPSDWGDTGLPIIRIQDLTGNSYQLNRYEGDYPARIEVNDGDVLISWSASLGVYVWQRGKALLNQHIFKVVFDKLPINIDYFVFAVEHKLAEMESKTHGATMKHIVKKDFDSTTIPYPAIEKQAEIAERLRRITALIEKQKEQLLLLDQLVKSRFIELFGDPVKNSMGWLSRPLNDVCDGIGDGLHGTPEYDDNGDYPFINGNNLIDGKIVITPATKMVSEEAYTKHLIDISSNAILISINGTLGKLAFYNGERVMLGKSACYCNLKPNINKVFVYGVMKSDAFAEFLDNSSTKSTIKNVGLKAMREYKLILPPTELQEQFAAFVEQIDKSKLAVQQGLQELEILKKSLMQQYFG